MDTIMYYLGLIKPELFLALSMLILFFSIFGLITVYIDNKRKRQVGK